MIAQLHTALHCACHSLWSCDLLGVGFAPAPQHHMTSLYSSTSLGKICLQNSPDWVLFFPIIVNFRKLISHLKSGTVCTFRTSLEHPRSSFTSSPVDLRQFPYKQQLPNNLPTFQVLHPFSLPLLQNQWDLLISNWIMLFSIWNLISGCLCL